MCFAARNFPSFLSILIGCGTLLTSANSPSRNAPSKISRAPLSTSAGLCLLNHKAGSRLLLDVSAVNSILNPDSPTQFPFSRRHRSRSSGSTCTAMDRDRTSRFSKPASWIDRVASDGRRCKCRKKQSQAAWASAAAFSAETDAGFNNEVLQSW